MKPHQLFVSLKGDQARSLIQQQLKEHSGGIEAVLAPYEVERAVSSLHKTIRAVEEFINIVLVHIDDVTERRQLSAIKLDDDFLSAPDQAFREAVQILSLHVEKDVASRFATTMLYSAAIGAGFRQHSGHTSDAGVLLASVGGAAQYYQSRRRHLVSLFYSMPKMCFGTRDLPLHDTLNVLLPQIEVSCRTITGLHQQLVLMDVFDDFALDVDSAGFAASHSMEILEIGFLEPERASIMAMSQLRPNRNALPNSTEYPSDKLFSAAEMRHAVKLIEEVYSDFGLSDDEFTALTQLVLYSLRYCHDDYFIEMPLAKFEGLLRAQSVFEVEELRELLLNSPGDFATNSNAYHPFICVNDTVISNVNLLQRFIYVFKNIHLGSRKRFQIHAGFIFEDLVKRDLKKLGFALTDIKRINRKEFDVVTTKNGAIHNFQCKNNYVDLAKVEADSDLFVRYNRRLVNGYKRALKKEKDREALLKTHLGLDRIQHYVISRFPVISDEPRIINYNTLAASLAEVQHSTS